MLDTFGKPLKRATWNTPGVHAVLTTCWRVSSVLGGACVACCMFLSTASYHVRIEIDSMRCCFRRYATRAFGAQIKWL